MSETTSAPNPWADIAVDLDTEDAGVWITDFLSPGWAVRVRSADSSAAQKIAQRQARAQRNVIISNNGMLPAATQRQNAIEQATALLVDWKGVQHPETGAVMDYTPANVAMILGDDRFKAFRRDVLWTAQQTSLFSQAAAQAMGGNLPNA